MIKLYSPAARHRGFTVIELLISLVIVVPIFFLIVGSLTQGLRSQSRADSISTLHKAISLIITDVTTEARWAQSLTISQASQTISILNHDNQTILYQLNDGIMEKKLADGTTIALNPTQTTINHMELVMNPNTYQPTGFTILLEIQSTQYPEHILKTLNPISLRLSNIHFTTQTKL